MTFTAPTLIPAPTAADIQAIVCALQAREPGAKNISVRISGFDPEDECALFDVDMHGYDRWQDLREVRDDDTGEITSYCSVEIAERWEIETEIATHYGEAGWCAAFLRALDEALHGNAESQAEKRFFGAVDSHDSVHYAGDCDSPYDDRYDSQW